MEVEAEECFLSALTDVMNILTLSSIDRGEHVFTLESIIKFAL